MGWQPVVVAAHGLVFSVSLVCLALLVNPLQEQGQRVQPTSSKSGIVVSQERLASEVGAGILRRGGNAIDAAVATAFALAVTLPQAGNLGGGGFLLFWHQGQRKAFALNFREMAPRRASAGMFLTADGEVDRLKATRSLLSTGVPGTVAGLLKAQQRFGVLNRAEVMAPAIKLARDGFLVYPALAKSLKQALPLLGADPEAKQIFYRLKPNSAAVSFYQPGEIFKQPQLAKTLLLISQQGNDGFYRGEVAAKIEALMQKKGGLIDRLDLIKYKAPWVEPIKGEFRGLTVLSMPPPSSGGVTLVQIMNLIEPFDLAQIGLNSAATIHIMVEAMNLAYRDRNSELGDPDQITIPIERLISKSYANSLRSFIRPDQHTPSSELAALAPLPNNSTNTTHLSVADRNGSLVALTTTLNFAYGNGVVVPGAGFLLNNEMDDFSAKPGVPNAYGLVQGERNRIAPGRRPLSSMAPTVVLNGDGNGWLATGSPGGSRIITTVLQVLLNRILHGLNLASAVLAPRVHSQLWPDQILMEEGISPDTQKLLEAKGHKLLRTAAMGSANSVEILPNGGSFGFADPRRPEGAAIPERY
jgi:gamma-glutamyltranspeptidase/glutathione hydrolase